LLVCIHGGGYSSRYFDVPGASLLDVAIAAGFNVFSVDRPDHAGSRCLPAGPLLIQRNAGALWEAIGELVQTRWPETRSVSLIGHSIGGAIAIGMAGQPAPPPGLALTGLAVSGIATEPLTPGRDFRRWIPPVRKLPLPQRLIFPKLFGPKGSYDPALARRSLDLALSWPVRQELMEIDSWWIEAAPEMAARVRVPIHVALGEYEGIWRAGVASLQRFAALFTASPEVHQARVPGAGHCIDHHYAGPSFQAAQVAFLRAQVDAHDHHQAET
jgi:pimeloyl-ACP methyl ester carboxylesterase